MKILRFRLKTFLLGILLSSFLLPLGQAQEYGWQCFVGPDGGSGTTDGTGGAARFRNPYDIAVDSAGNGYVADYESHTIRKVTPDGVTTTLAGAPGLPGFVDGTGAAARFNGPASLAVDAAGNVYVTDRDNHNIRKITPAGVVTTLAGSTTGLSGSADGLGVAARFKTPMAIAVTPGGGVYVGDTGNGTIRTISTTGSVYTLAGKAGFFGSTDGTGDAARLSGPVGLAVSASGIIYAAEGSARRIRKVTPSGVVTTFAGTGAAGTTDGPGDTARFRDPDAVAVDAAGYIYVADFGSHTIRKITPDGVVSTFAGSADLPGGADGKGSAARFYNPSGIAVDRVGNVLVSGFWQSTIRRITPTGMVTTLAGSPGETGGADGTGHAARFYYPQGLALDTAGNEYITDYLNHTIRKVTPAGVVTTLAGSHGVSGSANGIGSAARFKNPRGIAVDAAGNVFVSDFGNAVIRKITPSGQVSTFAGTPGLYGNVSGTGAAARFGWVAGLAFDSAGFLYLADETNANIRRITPGGSVTTLTGSYGSGTDGPLASATFTSPTGVAVDPWGNIYVSQSSACTIRKINQATGMVSTLAGSHDTPGSADGTGSAARFRSPAWIAADLAGSIYVADSENFTIRKITPSGTTTTIGGLAGSYGSESGTGADARFTGTGGIAVDAGGMVHVVDGDAARIVKGGPPFREISVELPRHTPLTDASSMVDFGIGVIGSRPVSRTITVRNSGTAVLTLSGITVDGANPADFVANTAALGSTLRSGGINTFTLSFTPSGEGPRSATIHLASDDGDESSFDIPVVGFAITALEARRQWRQLHFGTTDPTGDAADNADPDGDGWNNDSEYASGTLPNDPSSVLRLTALSPYGSNYLLSFPSMLGRCYAVEYTGSLLSGPWQPVLTHGIPATGIPGTGEPIMVPDTTGALAPVRFYRIHVGP